MLEWYPIYNRLEWTLTRWGACKCVELCSKCLVTEDIDIRTVPNPWNYRTR